MSSHSNHRRAARIRPRSASSESSFDMGFATSDHLSSLRHEPSLPVRGKVHILTPEESKAAARKMLFDSLAAAHRG